MKKTLFILLISVSLLFTSCFSAVYYNITQDVPPEPTTVSGVINSLVRYNVQGKEFLVCAADQGLRYKNANDDFHSIWLTYTNLPFSLVTFDYSTSTYNGQQIIKVLADSEYLYIVSTDYVIDSIIGVTAPGTVSIYAKKMKLADDGSWDLSGDWTVVATGTNEETGVDYFRFSIYTEGWYSDFNTFCTNSVQVQNRKAYIRSGNINSHNLNQDTYYYELNGLNTPKRIFITAFDDPNMDWINSAAVLNNNVYFFNSPAVTTNETSTTNATYIYYSYVYTLYYTDGQTGTDHTKIAISNCGTSISSLAVTKDSLLIGRGNYDENITTSNGGLVKTSLDENGVPGILLTSFTNNAQIQLSSSYLILTLLNTDPSRTEANSSLYSSIAFAGSGSSASASVNYNNVGLWSYYPSRGNWNRE